MYYITIKNGKAVAATDKYDSEAIRNGTQQNRNDWKTFKRVQQIAAELNAANPGSLFIPTDAGPNVSPRYDVMKMPRVGDDVSYCFNGDSYPCGTITKISKSLRVIEVSEGKKKFYRRKLQGSWINGGTWSLVTGHHYEQNPSF